MTRSATIRIKRPADPLSAAIAKTLESKMRARHAKAIKPMTQDEIIAQLQELAKQAAELRGDA